MSSTPVVDTPILVVLSVLYRIIRPSPPGANSVPLLPLVTPPSTSPVTPSSKQSQPLSSAPQSTMSASTATPTASPSSASPPTPLPTVSESPTSSGESPMPSSTSSTNVASSASQPTTSTPETSVQPTTSSTTTTPRTTQSSTQTSSSLSAATSGRTTSTSVMTTTPNMPFTTTTPSTSQGAPPVPLTTVTESTTIFITSTNSEGQVMTSIPAVVTEVITTTGDGGIVTTITQAVVNPTLAPNNSTTAGSSFFANTGAVVGVFVVVGLAGASILLWILFAIRHRQRMKRIEQDTAIEAVVAAAGLNRAPLDDDYEDASPISPSTRHQLSSEIGQRSSLFGLGDSGSLATSAYLLGDTLKDSTNSQTDTAVRRVTNYPKGYVPARTTSTEPFIDDLGSSRDRKSSYGHTPTYSAGSFEPLLASYAQNMQDQYSSSAAVQLPRNHPSQHPGSGFHGYSTDESPENRSRPSSRRQNSSDSFVLRDEDYAHYVLMVRNIPDDQSQHSL